MNKQPFVIERTYNVKAAKVWKAITDKNEMKHWYFHLDEFKPEPGFEFHFSGGPPDGIQYHHVCRVTEVVPGKKITYSWRYEGYDGISFVTFELSDEGDSTRLKLTHAGLDTFPQDNPDFAEKNFEAGWTDIIGEHLRKYLEQNQ
jgi:uncharacterized protein YndB with AHSA1/START domain